MTSGASRVPTVVSLGCRLNASEADDMRAHAVAAGLERAVLVNTCAVTGEAVRQGMQQIRRLRREHPDSLMVVTGCAAQIEPERFAALAEVDHVIGNAEKGRPETFSALAGMALAGTALARGQGAARVMVGDIMAESGIAAPAPGRLPAAIPRGFVQIQNGCDHRCTFCVIPFGRGRSRSLLPEQVVDRVREFVGRGVPEVVLSGVDITSWGSDLADRPSLGGLVRQVLREVPELARLRLSSIDQAEIDDSLLEALATEPRLMPHLHLSLQSGNDLILKRMRRRHSRDGSVAACAALRRARRDIALGADLIAGFPTESEEHFQDTLRLVDDCGLAFLHVFPYSARRGTPAARMPQVLGGVVRERATRLRDKGQMMLDAWLRSQVGGIIEASAERGGAGKVPARSAQFAQVTLTGLPGHVAAGATVTARVTGSDGRRLVAEALA
jgi:threonylcarbamoyladenosine tRNA methylthiotransferase MtaB